MRLIQRLKNYYLHIKINIINAKNLNYRKYIFISVHFI